MTTGKNGERRIRRLVAGLLLLTFSVVQPVPAGAEPPPAVALGKRYQDGLDSRYSAERLAQTTAALGYAATGYTTGRSAGNSWNDGLRSAVFGFFGHANAGIAQVNEGPDQILAAGTIADVDDSMFSYWSNYLPFVDIDDMRLAILAGCYTGNADPFFGSFGDIGRERGVDSVIGFTGLVFFPADCASCNYSGNYFWDRFSVYAQRGDTIGTALSKARADLVAKEGDAGGWNAWSVKGGVASPLDVVITPAGQGQPLDSKVLGIDPFDPFSLSIISTRTVAVGNMTYAEYATAEGVNYRRDLASGDLAWMSAPASTVGAVRLGQEDALIVARRFAESYVDDFDQTFQLVDGGPITHSAGDALAEFRWRPITEGMNGPSSVTVTVDLRKGSVVDLAATSHSPPTRDFLVTREQAEAQARAASGPGGVVTIEGDLWDVPRWSVTVERGMRGGFPDVSRFVVNATSGELTESTT